MKIKKIEDCFITFDNDQRVFFRSNEDAIKFSNKYKAFKDEKDVMFKYSLFYKEYTIVTNQQVNNIKNSLTNNVEYLIKELDKEYLTEFERLDINRKLFAIKSKLELLKELGL